MNRIEFMVDTADLGEIADALDHFPVTGVTCNPSIVKKTAPADFFAHARKMRALVTRERSLHIQVVSSESDRQMEEAERIFHEVDDEVYIKVPVTWEGLKTIKRLKAEGRNVTATAIYDPMQAYEALAAGADYLAVYVNRIGVMGGDPYTLIQNLEHVIARDNYPSSILAASFHSTQQVLNCLNAGAHAVTVPVGILKATYGNANFTKAVNDFRADWQSVYGDTDLVTVNK